ncbi:2,3-bisphosphoglycerate-dependent phosphoglycerate mutase [Williamsia sp. MIQD14]|uniref:2,3-bisphosphoglycerate-dependent phosphoglycerate mutase n=1 Tax=unclassified Williamsia TaxID=2636252 RepID=UPI0006F9F311|nr:2,3-bisphosphoglycerate-dependent phosphoglycerate mutase [Williamsia sp. Leaf354]KQR99997.1 hypothetical protein ASG12_04440 [Williamsia sp. Leaf354]MCX6468992.1 2,3-bisphosphoglycerate-dependent phosphoglycerate mutase [Mycobacteriales bacterium]
MTEGRLVIVRHGESVTNAARVFTGWLDVELTLRGRSEAGRVGRTLAETDCIPDIIHTSTLSRSQESARLICEALPRSLDARITAHRSLDERHYGAFTGRDKSEVLGAVGPEFFDEARNSLIVPPPPLSGNDLARLRDSRWPSSRLSLTGILTESLGDVVLRVSRFWQETLSSELGAGATVLVVAHGNSLRALLVVIEHLSQSELAARRLGTGEPLLYRFGHNSSPTVHGGETMKPPPSEQV